MAKTIKFDTTKLVNRIVKQSESKVTKLNSDLDALFKSHITDKNDLNDKVDRLIADFTESQHKLLQSTVDKLKASMANIEKQNQKAIIELEEGIQKDLRLTRTGTDNEINQLKNDIIKRVSNVPVLKMENVDQRIVDSLTEAIELINSNIESQVNSIKLTIPAVINGRDGKPGQDAIITPELLESIKNSVITRLTSDDKLNKTVFVGGGGGSWIEENGHLNTPGDFICYDPIMDKEDFPTREGCLFYSEPDNTLSFRNDILNTSLQIGQELWIRSANVSGVQINNGSVVFISGVQSDRPKLELALASDSDKNKVLGVVTADIDQGEEGWTTTFGLVRDFDTDHLTEGEYCYLSSSNAGELIENPTDNFIRVGLTIRSHPTDGVILVSIVNEDHNLLHGLQGGIDDEYYHLNEYQHSFQDITWDDLRVPVNTVNIQGVSNTPSWESSPGFGNLVALHFSPTTMNQVFFSIQLCHGYVLESNLDPHIHTSPITTDAGNVLWKLEYSIAAIGDVFSSPTTIQVVAPMSTTAFQHEIHDFPDIDGTGLGISSMLQCRLYRDAADPLDTYQEEVVLHEFDLHVQLDSRGSRAEYVK